MNRLSASFILCCFCLFMATSALADDLKIGLMCPLTGKWAANRIIEFLPDGTFVDKVSTYDEYLENDEMARKRQVYSMSESDENDN